MDTRPNKVCATTAPAAEVVSGMLEKRKSHHCPAFPSKLHAMLQDADGCDFDNILSWQPQGQSFKILDPDRFAAEVMPIYFSQCTKLKSFQRQLNTYGFKRIPLGPNKGGYSHTFFKKSNAGLCDKIIRKSTRGKRVQTRGAEKDITLLTISSDQQRFGQVSDGNENTSLLDDLAMHFDCIDEDEDMDGWFLQEVLNSNSPLKCYSNFGQQQNELASASSDTATGGSIVRDDGTSHATASTESSQFLGKVDTTLLRQGGRQQEEEKDHINWTPRQVVAEQDKGMDSISFPFKLHMVLQDAEKNGFDHIISWLEDGKAFKVHNHKAFVETVMPNYFDQTQYESFRRQLNVYGFQRVSKGAKRGLTSHGSFERNAPSLLEFIIRQPIKGGTTTPATSSATT
jgi:hypothetical protein